ncbi:MAG: preprotein translocase subunit SecE [Bacteroidota bacterium]|nr:preprotein translocase subunit SecE [Bacteroidota bacterium]
MKEKIIEFLTDTVKEMKKVTWPSKEELRESTVTVLAVCGIIIIFVFSVDWIVSNVLKTIL